MQKQNFRIAVNRIIVALLGLTILAGTVAGAIWLSELVVNWLWLPSNLIPPRLPLPSDTVLECWSTLSIACLILTGFIGGGLAELVIGNVVPLLLFLRRFRIWACVIASLLTGVLGLAASSELTSGDANLWWGALAMAISTAVVGILARRRRNEKDFFRLNPWERLIMSLPLIVFIGLLVSLVNTNLELWSFRYALQGVLEAIPTGIISDDTVQNLTVYDDQNNMVIIILAISAGILFAMALQPLRRNRHL